MSLKTLHDYRSNKKKFPKLFDCIVFEYTYCITRKNNNKRIISHSRNYLEFHFLNLCNTHAEMFKNVKFFIDREETAPSLLTVN